MSAGNRRIWDAWGMTPPDKTKKVEIGRKFTAICPYYQIEVATGIFGPVGKGWGWEPPKTHIAFENTPANAMLVMELTVWFENRENNFTLINAAQMFQKGGAKLDADVYKKLLTDTITKALSYLGSAADVFQGRYDDHRYVQDCLRLQAEQAQAAQNPPQQQHGPPATANPPQGHNGPPAQARAQQGPLPSVALPPDQAEREATFAQLLEVCAAMGVQKSEVLEQIRQDGVNDLAKARNMLARCIARQHAYKQYLERCQREGLAKEDAEERFSIWLANLGGKLLCIDPGVITALARGEGR